MQRIWAISLLVVSLAAVGCSDSNSPASPDSTLNIQGSWAGPVAVNDSTARMTWTLVQNGTSLTGPVTLALTSGVVLMNGMFNGTLTGASLTGTITVTPGGIPVYPTCTGQLNATMNATLGPVSTLAGPVTLVSSTCTVPFTSNVVTLTRS